MLYEGQWPLNYRPFGANAPVCDERMSSDYREALLLLLAQINDLLESRWCASGRLLRLKLAHVHLQSPYAIAHRTMDLDLEMRALIRRVEHLADEGLDVDVCWRVWHPYAASKRRTVLKPNGGFFRSFLFDAANPIPEEEVTEGNRPLPPGPGVGIATA